MIPIENRTLLTYDIYKYRQFFAGNIVTLPDEGNETAVRVIVTLQA